MFSQNNLFKLNKILREEFNKRLSEMYDIQHRKNDEFWNSLSNQEKTYMRENHLEAEIFEAHCCSDFNRGGYCDWCGAKIDVYPYDID